MSGFVADAQEDEFGFDSGAWQDLPPVEVEKEDVAAVAIVFTEEFREIMGYFRAVLARGEKSPRALWLTEQVIEHNPANYTAWYYRRQCLQALNADLAKELEFVSEQAEEHPKNYQIWFHRRAIVDMLNDGSKELEFTRMTLVDDSKNYHAWSHRQWVLRRFDLWEGELDYVTELLEEDLRNNSAWNERWFVIQHTRLAGKEGDAKAEHEVIENEIKYAQAYIDKAPNNESPFNYISGLLRGRRFADYPLVREGAEKLYEKQMNAPDAKPSPYLLGLLVDIYAQEEELKPKAKALCEDLATRYDLIRQKYWIYRKSCI